MGRDSERREILGAGWSFPVRLGAGGGFELSRGERDVAEAIRIVLATAPGERAMRPDFGCGIHDLTFTPNNPATHGLVAQQVRQALGRWEPRIDVEEVRAEAAPGMPETLLIRIDYRVRSTHASHSLVYPFSISEGGRA